MKVNDIPQDNIAMYKGGKKALYATVDDGKFEIIQSSGWNVEEIATLQAVYEFERLEAEAYAGFCEGKLSPLGVWMYRSRMSIATLSQCTGFWQWRIKRHLKSNVFNGLDAEKIGRYCDVFNITLDELRNPKETK
jgi:hypothetical protein